MDHYRVRTQFHQFAGINLYYYRQFLKLFMPYSYKYVVYYNMLFSYLSMILNAANNMKYYKNINYMKKGHYNKL